MKKLTNFFWIYLLGILIFTTSLVYSSVVKKSPIKAKSKPNSSVQLQGHTIWGSSAAPYPGENIDRIEAWKRLNEKIKSLNGGFGLEGHRTYDRGLPASWSASNMAGDVGLCKVSFGSIKPNWAETANGNNYEAIKKFVQSIPDDQIVYLIFHHEPEDNVKQKGNSIELLKLAFAKFVDAVLTSGKPNVHPCFNLMSYTFKPQSGRNPDDFNLGAKLKPEQLSKVIAALDGYAQTPDISAKDMFEPNFEKMASWGFTRFGIFETGVHAGKNIADRAKWVDELGQWVNSRKDIELVSWFHSGVGSKSGNIGWFLGTWVKNGNNYSLEDSDGTIATYSKLLRSKKK